MKGTIVREGKIIHGAGGLELKGWQLGENSDFTLQDLVTISSAYPEGTGPLKFGIDPPPPRKKHQEKQISVHQFRRKKKRLR
jgi:hypothetical protein